MKRQSVNETKAVYQASPWTTPGPQKEAWKLQGNLCDYRVIKASRPAGLVISISGPRQFGNV
jgi:hypothetical protein